MNIINVFDVNRKRRSREASRIVASLRVNDCMRLHAAPTCLNDPFL